MQWGWEAVEGGQGVQESGSHCKGINLSKPQAGHEGERSLWLLVLAG